MNIYFLRHGRADWPAWEKPDDERPLTSKGKKEMRQVAKFLRALEIPRLRILSSPLPRAWQTAQIAAEYLGLEVKKESALGKGFSAARLRALIKASKGEDLMLVGHEPDFSAVIRSLTGGEVKLAKGGIARVDSDEAGRKGRLLWLLPPKLAKC